MEEPASVRFNVLSRQVHVWNVGDADKIEFVDKRFDEVVVRKNGKHLRTTQGTWVRRKLFQN